MIKRIKWALYRLLFPNAAIKSMMREDVKTLDYMIQFAPFEVMHTLEHEITKCEHFYMKRLGAGAMAYFTKTRMKWSIKMMRFHKAFVHPFVVSNPGEVSTSNPVG